MPVARYFLYVGGVLLALLFAIDPVPQEAALASHSAPGIDVDGADPFHPEIAGAGSLRHHLPTIARWSKSRGRGAACAGRCHGPASA